MTIAPTRCPNCKSSEVVKLADGPGVDGLYTCRACGGYVPSSQTGVIEINQAQRALQVATIPAQTKAVESFAAAAQAWAKEQGDYELFVSAAHIYILARRKTTELIAPEIQHGGDRKGEEYQGNGIVTLMDYGFTKMQWSRRVKELSITQSEIDDIVSTLE